eukprot:365570-Chlamydomonas_euryale.AAC.6
MHVPECLANLFVILPVSAAALLVRSDASPALSALPWRKTIVGAVSGSMPNSVPSAGPGPAAA